MGKKKKAEKTEKKEKLEKNGKKLKADKNAKGLKASETEKAVKTAKTEDIPELSPKSEKKSAGGRKTRERNSEDQNFQMAEWFRALGDENRIRIMDILLGREMNAKEILEKMDISQSTLSHHMKVLTEGQIVSIRKVGRKSYYRISEEAIEVIRDHLDKWS